MFRSIRVKLTLWYIGAVAIVFAAFAFATYSLFVRVLQDEARTNVTEMANNFVKTVTQEQKEGKRSARPEGAIIQTLDDFHFRDYHFAVFAPDNHLIGKTMDQDLPPDLPASIGENHFSSTDLDNVPFNVLERTFRLDGKPYKLLVFFSLDDQISIENRIQRIFIIVAPILLLFAGLGGYFLAREGLKPVAIMGERAKSIGAANLHERLPVANPNDEIGNLAVVFNQLLDRLDQEFERQRRFMADASHELRTPLAIVQGESEVALQKDTRSREEYQDSLRIVNDEGKRLTKIVEDLFTLARADSGDANTNFKELYLNEILEDCVTSIRTLARKHGITLQFSGEEVKFRGDELLLRRLFINLLDNAVKYNYDGGLVDVNIKGTTVEVQNTGPEIPAGQSELVFERFYRIDKTHARLQETLTSGAGLGLSISKWIARIHHAEITHSRSVDGKNIFSVVFKR
ncbi:MAG: ATP-binding protein [Acidobacteriota bacterium]